MVYLDLIMNLALLVALSVLSGFIDKRWPRDTWPGVLLQGFLFGTVTILGMLRPLVLGPGLIFDGRSIIISLCALFFGHWAASLTGAMAAAYRLELGGPGMVMGVLVILTSAVIGLLARHYIKPLVRPPSTSHLFFLGLAVHAAMVALMFTLPGELAMSTIKRLGLPVIILYPLATILAGKILTDQVTGTLNTKALQESEERYRRLFEDHAAVKLLIDPATADIIDANKAAEIFYGWPREKLKQMKISDINTLSPVEVQQEMEKARGEKKIYFEFRHRLADGSIRDVGVFSSKIEVKGKDLLRSIIHDVTERKQAEERLRESEDKYRSLIENITDIIFTIDLEGKITFVSYGAKDILGYENTETINMNILDFIPKEEQQRAIENLQKGMKGEKIKHFPIPLIAKSGKRLFFECSFSRVYKDGAVVGAQGTAVDITERKQTEEEVRKLTKELEKRVTERTKKLHDSQLALLNVVDDLNENARKLAEANQSLESLNKELESFAYSVSHDLRAPLRSIDGFSAALLEDYKSRLDATGKNYLERVRNASQRMGELIDDILKLSRVIKSDFRPAQVNLSEMVKQAINACAKTTAKAPKIQVQNDIMVKGDAALLRIAISNLIDNAFKFSAKQKNALVEFGATQEEGNTVYYVRDNGVGFDMTYVHKLFGAFQRLHSPEEFPGTGIGLTTVQRIIHRHGGKVWAKGEVGKGATFFFTLPE